MALYIQRRDHDRSVPLETVDELSKQESRWEFRKRVSDYNDSDYTAHYYLSQRPCKDWHNDTKDTIPNT